MWKLTIIITLFLCSHTLFSQDWKVYPYSPPASLLSFPEDEGRHPAEPVEWWYTTGHLTGETSGRSISYMLSYFYSPYNIFDGFRILNISDDDSGLFLSDTKPLNYSTLSTDSLNIVAGIYPTGTEYWQNSTDGNGYAIPFRYKLSAETTDASIILEYDATKRPLILADSGLLDQGPAAYTYYYSLTGNDVTGIITFNGITENVTGSGWIDRQYGTVNPAEGLEYEWFSLQLSNGMDINMNNIFTSDNEIPETLDYRLMSVYVDEDTQHTTSSFQLERLGYSYTPDNRRCYSNKWRLTSDFNNIDMVISVINPDTEVVLPFRFYEGPTIISGTVNGNPVEGRGFAELLHSYEEPDISIQSFTNIYDQLTELKWQLNNPDDGNPLKYDLEYSTDGLTYFTLAQSLDDTVYIWDSRDLAGENDIWLKVTGFSVDTTLANTRSVWLGSTTDIEFPQSGGRVEVYPNPAEGKITVSGDGICGILIVDRYGRRVYESDMNKPVFEIDLRSEPPGIYFIKISFDKDTTTRKVILF